MPPPTKKKITLLELLLEGAVPSKSIVDIRWMAIGAQIIALLVAYQVFSLVNIPLYAAVITVVLAVVVNFIAEYQRIGNPSIPQDLAAAYLGFDIIQLATLINLTGGLDNPLAIFLLAPVAVASSLLSFGWVVFLAVLAIACLTSNAIWHFPLPMGEQALVLPRPYAWSVWLGLTLAALFIAGYTWSVARASRRLNQALADTRLSLASARQVNAMGALAAAVAHELGTPLATISLVSRELQRDLPEGTAQREDVDILVSQAERCRQVLAQFARQPAVEGGDPYQKVMLNALLEEISAPYRRPEVNIRVEATPPEIVNRRLRRSPELQHGLANVIQNAIQFARTEVVITAQSREGNLRLVVQDNGPGFSSSLLSRLGEPYLSQRAAADRAGHMGLGVFIAKTLLSGTGADIRFANGPEGGAMVSVEWPAGAEIFPPEDAAK